ncbi:hypothetical protein GOA68_11155 [Sinorhizobium meliloti]|nr:hypothetical protein [Sinorhizobium meliloti]MDW9988886.1 hypothetical protein [Sinorhizobium meliloti]MDX0243397.1 hypothetical protein [Sinorhizobium meliloti]MDX0399232.1 hypothetical protein [Sinorhizobium meliloti]RVP08763.1 hypothetical protein CN083_11720 [Sinorhizobium meliloti]
MVLDDGGKGSNQAMCAARLTGKTSLVSAIGTDRGGEEGLALLSAEGCDVSGVLRSPDLPTGVSLAAIDSAGMSNIITDPGANLMLTADAAKGNEAFFVQHRFCLLPFESPKDGALEAARLVKETGCQKHAHAGPDGRPEEERSRRARHHYTERDRSCGIARSGRDIGLQGSRTRGLLALGRFQYHRHLWFARGRRLVGRAYRGAGI